MGLLAAALAGCALWPAGHWKDMDVLARSDYCGTPSERANIAYFADATRFQTWINNRSISGFDADLAANGGVIVVEMGLRPTGGYSLALDPDNTGIGDDTLRVGMDLQAPALNAKVSQALNSQCVVLSAPRGNYRRIELIDQLGNRLDATTIDRSRAS